MLMNIFHSVSYEGERKIAIPQSLKIRRIAGKPANFEQRVECNIEEFKGLSSESADRLDKHQQSISQSQTNEPMLYTVKDETTGYKITIVDTPGLNDTRGTSSDEEHIQAIIHAIFIVGGVHMICIVHNASEPRLFNGTELALTRLMNIFSKSCKKNFAVCLSNSTDRVEPTCLDTLEKIGIPSEHIFRFESNCLTHPNIYRELSKNMIGKVAPDVERTIIANKGYWEQNVRSANTLIDTCNDFGLMDVEGVKNIYHQKHGLDNQIQVFTEKLRMLEETKQKLEDQRVVVRKIQMNAESNKNFDMKTKVLEIRKRMVTKEKKEKKYHKHSSAKIDDRAKKWSWAGWTAYGVCSILTIGILPAVDITHSVVCDQFGIVYEDYYDWETTTYEEEETYYVEVDKITIDEEKKKKHEEAKEEQILAEAYLQKIESDLKAADHDYDTCLYLLWYLSEKLEKNMVGNSVGIELIQKKLEIELQLNHSKDKSRMESKIREMRREQEILKIARSRKSNQLDSAKYTDAIFKLKAEILEEQANEGKKLSNRRKFCSILKPSLINKKEYYQEIITNIKTQLNQRLGVFNEENYFLKQQFK
jgi:hypothetical protein